MTDDRVVDRRVADTQPAGATYSERSTPTREASKEAVPKDTEDAQQQAFVEQAEDEAKTAQREAEAAIERANKMNEEPSRAEARAEKDERPRDINGQVIVQPGDIVRAGPAQRGHDDHRGRPPGPPQADGARPPAQCRTRHDRRQGPRGRRMPTSIPRPASPRVTSPKASRTRRAPSRRAIADGVAGLRDQPQSG